MTKFRKRLKKYHLEDLLTLTIKSGLKSKAITPSSFNHVNTDTTVMEKNIAFPTDARLYYKAITKLVKMAKETGVTLRHKPTPKKLKRCYV